MGTATLLIGANLPDLDALAYLDGPAADLQFRRGWTHGLLAMALLPFLLTGFILLADRLLRRMRRASLPSAVRPREVLLLGLISIVSHPLLDWLNTYGVRWMMPFSDRWFYGDILFIIDPWAWLLLGAGVVLSRPRRHPSGFRNERSRPARVALGLTAVYVVLMWAAARAAAAAARTELAGITGAAVDRLMLSPAPANPLLRTVVASQGEVYRVAQFQWLRSPHIAPGSVETYSARRPDHPAMTAALETPLARRFLIWARFPVFQLDSEAGGGYLVRIVDLRYARPPATGFGSVAIPVNLAAPPLNSRSLDSGTGLPPRTRQ
jgi:inner membrane protein